MTFRKFRNGIHKLKDSDKSNENLELRGQMSTDFERVESSGERKAVLPEEVLLIIRR